MRENRRAAPRKKQLVMERKGKLEELDRSFDVQFWQAQNASARFSAAWEMVVLVHKLKGKDVSELRLQRHIENFQRQSS